MPSEPSTTPSRSIGPMSWTIRNAGRLPWAFVSGSVSVPCSVRSPERKLASSEVMPSNEGATMAEAPRVPVAAPADEEARD